nr:MAG TPA: hypothetical protein [Caudoviricetes sp.]DAH86241.1 MAG TPA: hypothetical protein [Bacteriophage sp.]
MWIEILAYLLLVTNQKISFSHYELAIFFS